MEEVYRVEHDSLGEMKVPAGAYYGANTLRAVQNFPITGNPVDREFIRAMVEVKKAAAMMNLEVHQLNEERAHAIINACDRILAGENLDQFVVDPIQGGAGTSFNMNTNEVIANMATEALGGKLGSYDPVHPNDHVNEGQSTNDVIPTSGKIAMIRYFMELKDEATKLNASFDKKSREFDSYIKMGRTQNQDAVPIRLGQEFAAYTALLKRDVKRFDAAIDALSVVNLGGTAIGTGLNADVNYVKNIVPKLNEVTGLKLKQNEDLIDGTQNLDGFLVASSVLKNYALSLSKIANDLRFLSSGPRSGIHEITLPARQAGSSIMPGKVNPVIPEVVNQMAFAVVGNDMTVTMCVEGGQLELNAFEPVCFYKIFESLRGLKGAIYTFRVHCIDGLTANKKNLEEEVHRSVGIVTALAPHIGYITASRLAKTALATNKSLRDLVLEEKLMTEEKLDRIFNPYAMTHPGIAGKDSDVEEKSEK